MTDQIKPQDYIAWAEIILSDQIPRHEVPKLLKDNPFFADWFRLHVQITGDCNEPRLQTYH